MRSIIYRFILLFYLILIPFAIFTSDNKKVLLLNSYHRGYTWSDHITEGIEGVLEDEFIEVHTEYLDTKRQYDIAYIQKLSDVLEYKFHKHEFDLIITSDNNAFNMVMEYRERLFDKIPIVFCGLNYINPNDFIGLDNITGINEKADIVANIELILQLHPDTKRVVTVVDNTQTGKILQEEITDLDKLYSEVELSLLFDYNLNELEREIAKYESGTIILLAFFFRDKSDEFYEFNVGLPRITAASSVPVYGLWDFSINQGVVGGYVIDGFKHGIEAGETALRVLNGENVNNIPIKMETSTTLEIDYLVANEYSINTSELENVVYINRPISFIEENREILLYGSILFMFLSVSLIALIFAYFRSRKANYIVHKKALEYSTLVNNIPGVTFRFKDDIEHTMLLAGEGIRDITGYDCSELVDNSVISFGSLAHEDDRELVHQVIWDSLINKKHYDIEYRIIHKNGQVRWIFESGRPVWDENGTFLYFDGLCIDITRQKEDEVALNEYRDHLEALVQERTEEVHRYMDDLKETQHQLLESRKMESMGTLVTGVAHEINTPVGIAVTSVSYIKDLIKHLGAECEEIKKNPEVQSRIETIHECTELAGKNLERIGTIVNNFKKVAVDQSIDEVKTFNLYEYLNDIFENFYTDSKIGKHKIFFECPKDLIVKNYPGAITRIISYLISNSINHGFRTVELGVINIRITEEENKVILDFKDNGPGIDNEIEDKIFDPFFTTDRGGGYQGLGLHIVYNLVHQKLNGEIKYKDSFIITFPKEV